MKKLLSILLLLIFSLITNAEPVEINGIYYNLVTKAKIAEVTYTDEKDYSGDIVIPETVTYGDVVYNVTSIGKFAFWYDREVTSVSIPNSIVSIGEGAFNNCTGLTSISIPNSVSSMDERVFQGCSGLTTINIPNTISIIKEACFEGCQGLTSVILPNSIKTLETSAFGYCTNLQSITLPEDLTSIGKTCFIECKSLSSISIPQSVNTIGNQAFGYCYALTSIELPNTLTEISRACFIGCKKLSSFTIPNSVSLLRYSSFEDCSMLNEINIPNSVSAIENNAFAGCSALKTVYIGKGIRQIGSKAFSKCTELTDVYCYAKEVPNTQSDVFQDSYIEYTALHVPVPVVNLYKESEPWKNFKEITGVASDLYTLTYKVDDEIYKKYVYEVGEAISPEPAPTKEGYTFSGWSEIPETMPAHDVTVSGKFSVYVPGGSCGDNVNWTLSEDGKTLTISGTGAMAGYAYEGYPWYKYKNNIQKLIIEEGVSTINSGAFYECDNINSVTLPATLTSIGAEAFKSCSALESIIIPDAVTSIGSAAFKGCTSLTSIALPPTLTVLSEGLFAYCAFKTFTIPEGVAKLENGCLGDCPYLEEIIIPASVEDIEGFAFAGNPQLQNVYCYKKGVPNTGSRVFEGSKLTGTLHVPSNSVNLYKESSPWSGFANIVALLLSKEESLEKIEANINIMKSAEQSLQDAYNKTAEIENFEPSQLSSFAEAVKLNIQDYDAVITKLEALKEKLNKGESVTEEEIDNLKCEDLRTALLERLSAYEEYVITTSFTSNEGGKINVGNITIKNEIKKVSWFYSKAYISDPHVDVYKSLAINVVPDEGYHIKSIDIDGSNYTSTTSYTGDGLQGQRFTATFEQDAKPTYKLLYIVDGETYKSYDLEEGTPITPEAEPTKEGYTFSGWSEIPETMPANDVTVTGTFTINKYKLTYTVDGEVYKEYEIEYGASITPEAAPTKEGYEFSGWSEIPETMPAHDVTITGSFKQVVYDVEDVKYEVSGEGTVTIKGGDQKGNVEISATVVINGQTYNVTAIAENAFKDNAQITSLTIPDGIKSIGDNAFSGCVGLLVINIGKSVTSIGNKAFANIGTASSSRTRADNTLTVNCYTESVPQTATDAFENSPIATGTLLVNDNIVDAYKTTAPWSGFGKIQGFQEAAGINAISIDSPNTRIYDMQGNRIDNLQKGVNIIRTENGSVKKIMVK